MDVFLQVCCIFSKHLSGSSIKYVRWDFLILDLPSPLYVHIRTVWNVSKYGVFSGRYFPAFGLNVERYEVSLRIKSECGKIQARKNSVFGHISRSDAFSLHPLPPSTSLWTLLFKKDITAIFCELLSIKEPQTNLQNKETTVQSYRKMLSQNTKKNLDTEFALFNCTR